MNKDDRNVQEETLEDSAADRREVKPDLAGNGSSGRAADRCSRSSVGDSAA